MRETHTVCIYVPVTSRQDAMGNSALRAADWGRQRAGRGSVWIAHEKESRGARYSLKLHINSS